MSGGWEVRVGESGEVEKVEDLCVDALVLPPSRSTSSTDDH